MENKEEDILRDKLLTILKYIDDLSVYTDRVELTNKLLANEIREKIDSIRKLFRNTFKETNLKLFL